MISKHFVRRSVNIHRYVYFYSTIIIIQYMRKFVELYGIMIDILSHGVWWTESQKNNMKDNFSPLDRYILYLLEKSHEIGRYTENCESY